MSAPSTLDTARTKVLERGESLSEAEILEVLSIDDEHLTELLELAHEVRIKHCGVEVSLEGIISLKTGGCPEDCHFCSQSGLFESPVRAVRLNIEELVEGARQSAKMGASEFCIVAAVKGPTERLLDQVKDAIAAINAEVDISISASLGILSRDQARQLREMGVSRYNHNFETARSFFPNVVTTHTWDERKNTLEFVRAEGMEVCCGGIIGLGETLEQRAEFAAQLAEVTPHEVPMNFLDPRPGTPSPTAPWCLRARRCARSPRSGLPCPPRSCASPAALSSRSATTAPRKACSEAPTRLSAATTSPPPAGQSRPTVTPWTA